MLAAIFRKVFPVVTLHSRGAPVIGRGATLEINARGQPMRIE